MFGYHLFFQESLVRLTRKQGVFAIISDQYFDQISTATTKFQQSVAMDPKAAVLPTYNSFSGTVSTP